MVQEEAVQCSRNAASGADVLPGGLYHCCAADLTDQRALVITSPRADLGCCAMCCCAACADQRVFVIATNPADLCCCAVVLLVQTSVRL
jgi:hypothetical protein